MKNIAIIILASLTVVISSCEKIIEPELNGNVAQLVIQGSVTDSIGPYKISITRTADFYAENVYEPVSGANVYITDVTLNVTDTLTEITSGMYSTQILKGIPGNTYVLKVDVEGKEYTSSSTMPKAIALDSVTISYEKSDNFEPVVHYQDPADYQNYYKYSILLNGVSVKRFQTFQDLLSNGKFITDNLSVDDNTIKSGDLVVVTLANVDHNVYEFLKAAQDVAYDNDELVSPALPTSNILGGCIGYFSAQSVSSAKVIVK
jgi:hypothetical protein